jgi:serine/threonine protein kinase
MNTLDRGRYEVVRILGDGPRDFSTVYEANDTTRGRRVAIKCLPLDGPRGDIARAMFKKEVESLDGLDHPAIVQLLGRFEETDKLGIVLELIPGGQTLEALIDDVRAGRAGPLPLHWCLQQLGQLLSGLQAAHHRGIIHRDIKPSNVLYDPKSGDLKLADFGVAQVLNHYTRGTPGRTLREFYTLPYAAPEQVLGRHISFPADLHAFGVLAGALLGWVLPEADFRPQQMLALVAPLLDQLPETEARHHLLEVLGALVHEDPVMRPKPAEVAPVFREVLEEADEPTSVPLVVTGTALKHARDFGIQSESALLDDLSQSLRAEYRAEKDQAGNDSFVVRCYGKSAWALCRPDVNFDGGLVVVDAGRRPPSLHQKHRSQATAVPVIVEAGTGSAEALYAPAYAAYVSSQEKVAAVASKNDFLRVARFILRRERERLLGMKFKYQLLDAAGQRQPSPSVTMVQGAHLTLGVVAVVRGTETINAAIDDEWDKPLNSQSAFLVNGNRLGDYESHDRGARTITIRITKKTKLNEVGFVQLSDVAAETSLKRQERALDRLVADECINPRLGRLLLEPSLNELGELMPCELLQELKPASEIEELVQRATAARDFFLIQGPPGTGKTAIIAEVVGQILVADPAARILLTSQSHAAVDNALERLSSLASLKPRGWRLLRDVPEKAGRAPDKAVRTSAHNLDATFEAWVKETRAKSAKALEALQRDDCESLAEIRLTLARWSNGLAQREDVRDDYARSVNVFGVTCMRVPTLRDVLREERVRMDWVIVDEAAKATPAEVLVSLAVGKRFVLVGDHRQLPPYLDNETAKDVQQAGIDVALARRSLFEEVFERMPNSNRAVLKRQHRMHRSIGNLVSTLYYADVGGLITAVSDSARALDIPRFSGEERVHWCTVNGRERAAGTSWWNEEEIQCVRDLLNWLENQAKQAGTRYSVGVIAPYLEQKIRLARFIRPDAKGTRALTVEIDTVDAFQGRQVDILIYSLVRTSGGQNPFLSDSRRLNVAFSRAKRLLLIVGNHERARNVSGLSDLVRLIPKSNYFQLKDLP